MASLRPSRKQLAALIAATGLVVLLVLVLAVEAMASAGFLSSPIGSTPGTTVQRVQALPVGSRKAVVSVSLAPRPVVVQTVSKAVGRCYTEPGTPPASVLDRESKGNPAVYNFQGSGASGCWQFMPGTWGGYKGYANAADAPVSVQNEKAKQVWAEGAGCRHWSQC